ncbi:MAG: hypothetical protein F6K19_49185 [Cyanothece sp. SIO1E1]|nr:hypothetical protein [Cyanothece sp. SIO1E1]
MKYRRLHIDELQGLEKDFINFLAANSVTSDDWEKLKNESQEKAEKMIEIFSDMIFEQTLQKVDYLEQKSAREIRTYHCGPDKISMIGILVEGETSLDFRQNLDPQQMMAQLGLSGAQLKLFKGEKTYKKERNLELFDLMERGALISRDGHLYKTLAQL